MHHAMAVENPRRPCRSAGQPGNAAPISVSDDNAAVFNSGPKVNSRSLMATCGWRTVCSQLMLTVKLHRDAIMAMTAILRGLYTRRYCGQGVQRAHFFPMAPMARQWGSL